MRADEDLIQLLQAALEQAASPKTKDWWEKYLRNVIEFRGIGIPEIRVRLVLQRKVGKGGSKSSQF